MNQPLDNSNSNIHLERRSSRRNIRNNANYCSERLVVRGNIIEVRATKLHLFLMSLFMLFSLIIASMPCIMDESIVWPAVFFGGVFYVVGCGFFIAELRKPHPLLNLTLRQFYPNGMKSPNQAVPLNSFSHLEIAGRIVHNPKGQNYPCYSLNAVLDDDKRHTILNHGNLKKLREDARLLADILNLQIHEENLSPQVSQPKQAPPALRRILLIIVLLFSLLFLAVGGHALWEVCIKPLHNWNVSRHWTPTPTVIVHSALAEDIYESIYRVYIRYDYEFNGVSYQGTRYDFFRSDNYSHQNSSMLKAVDDNPVGKATTCLVNPARPEEAVLSRALPYSQIPWFLFPLPFIFFGLFIPFLAIKTLCSQGQKP